jgi:hypothetical protein
VTYLALGKALRQRVLALLRDRSVPIFILIGIAALYGGAGVLSDPEYWKAGVGFLLGASLLSLSYGLARSIRSWTGITRALLALHSLFLLSQYAVVASGGSYPDPFVYLGTQSRVFSSITRFSGFFLEPATFALTITALLAVYLKSRRRRWPDLVVCGALGAILVSQSLWGCLAGPVVVALWLKRNVTIAIALCALASVFMVGEISVGSGDAGLVDRLQNLSEDASANERYSGLLTVVGELSTNTLMWFGHGVSWSAWEYGANGLSFLVYSVGLVGAIAFLGCLTALAQSKRVATMMTILVILTAAPIWGQMFIWLWLAIFLSLKPQDVEPPRSFRKTML